MDNTYFVMGKSILKRDVVAVGPPSVRTVATGVDEVWAEIIVKALERSGPK